MSLWNASEDAPGEQAPFRWSDETSRCAGELRFIPDLIALPHNLNATFPSAKRGLVPPEPSRTKCAASNASKYSWGATSLASGLVPVEKTRHSVIPWDHHRE